MVGFERKKGEEAQNTHKHTHQLKKKGGGVLVKTKQKGI